MKKTSAFIALIAALSMTAAPIQGVLPAAGAITASAAETAEHLTYYENDDGTITVSGCTENVREITVPAEIDGKPVTRISDNAFGGWFHCDLEKVTLPDSVVSIGEYAFEECLQLKSVNTANVKSIGKGAFLNCPQLNSLELGSGLEQIGGRAFAGCPAVLTISPENRFYRIENGIMYTFDGKTVITADRGMTECTMLPGDLKTIAAGAFEGCYKLTKVHIPDSVTKIGDHAFYECSQLTSVDLPHGLKRIEEYTFCICQSLESIELPEGLTYIGREAFTDDYKMLSMKVPASVKEIGAGAIGFYYADGDCLFKIRDFVLECKLGSAADKYAYNNELGVRYFGKTDISKAKVKAENKYYTGKALKPAVTVKLGWKTLKSGSDYTVKYSANKKVGRAKYTVTGKGGASGSVSGTFIIRPAKVKVKSFKSTAKKSVKAVWTRDKQVSGYNVELALNKGFTKGYKSLLIKKNSTTSKTFKQLKSGKTYYFRVRSFAVINSSKRYYSKYSTIKKVICK